MAQNPAPLMERPAQPDGRTANAPPNDSELVSRAEAHSEVYEYLHASQLRREIFPRAALVGLLAGLLATAFRVALSAGDNLRNGLIDWAHQFAPWGIIAPVAVGAGGAALIALGVIPLFTCCASA